MAIPVSEAAKMLRQNPKAKANRKQKTNKKKTKEE
jgi:hypothetical protein